MEPLPCAALKFLCGITKTQRRPGRPGCYVDYGVLSTLDAHRIPPAFLLSALLSGDKVFEIQESEASKVGLVMVP